MKRLKLVFANLSILTLSVLMGLALSEIGVRLFLNPADYVSATMVKDPVLGHKIEAGSSGFDDWGFRNPRVPAKVDMVAVGDSQTYGNNVTMTNSWPYVAGASGQLSVYNLGLGGYGPNDYLYLLEQHLSQLKPRWVVCGLYLGDDFENAFATTYARDHWAFLRKGSWSKVDADAVEPPDESTIFRRLTNWFSRRSVVYRLVVHGPLLGTLKGTIQIRRVAQADSGSGASLRIPESQINEAFQPLYDAGNLDPNRPQIREGIRITLELLERMNSVSQRNGAVFVVLLIPTKESVFADYLIANPQTRFRSVIQKLADDERAASDEVKDSLRKLGIPYVEVLPDLRQRVRNHLYVVSDKDMHLNQNGQRIVGQAVATFLRTHSIDSSSRIQ